MAHQDGRGAAIRAPLIFRRKSTPNHRHNDADTVKNLANLADVFARVGSTAPVTGAHRNSFTSANPAKLFSRAAQIMKLAQGTCMLGRWHQVSTLHDLVGCGYGSGRSTTLVPTLKCGRRPPIPSVRVKMSPPATRDFLRKWRSAWRQNPAKVNSFHAPIRSATPPAIHLCGAPRGNVSWLLTRRQDSVPVVKTKVNNRWVYH